MKPEEFLESVIKDADKDYGLCPPPITAEKGMEVLINHFLGEVWYTSMLMSSEQVYTQAVYEILEANQRLKSVKGFTITNPWKYQN